MAVLGVPGLAFAAEAGGGWIGPFAVIAAGLGMAIASGLCGLGQGRAIAAAVEAMGRRSEERRVGKGCRARWWPCVAERKESGVRQDRKHAAGGERVDLTWV